MKPKQERVKRNYHKEPDLKYGRPKKKISKIPPSWFSNHDDLVRKLDARDFLRLIVAKQNKDDWEKRVSKEWPHGQGIPLFELDEINHFLKPLSPLSVLKNEEEAAHAKALGFVVISIDPHVPNLASSLKKIIGEIRKDYPFPVRRKVGRQSIEGDMPLFDETDLQQWKDHRILALYDLRLRDFVRPEQRKQIASWLFPEIKNQTDRGNKLDKAQKILDQFLSSLRSIDAQTR